MLHKLLMVIVYLGVGAAGWTDSHAVSLQNAVDSAASRVMNLNIFARTRDLLIEYSGEGGWYTVVQVFTIVFLALLLDFFQRRLLARIKRKFEQTETPWDDAVLDAMTAPIAIIIWVLGLLQAIAFVNVESLLIHDLVSLTLIFAGTWFAIRLIKNIQTNLIQLSQKKPEEDRLDPVTVDAMGKLVRLAVMITAILISLDQIGVNISALLAFGGIGGIAIGFAAKDLLANFFGGLMIYLDRPFKVGDWVRSPDRNIEGTVESIGWRLTRIRTFDKRPLYIPNSVFATIAIENPQRMTNRRIYETFGIRYDDVSQMNAITADVESMLKNHPEIDTRQMMMVYFNAFGPSSMDFFVYTFTKTTDWKHFHKVKHEILLKISDIIAGHGAEFAFPTSTLHVASLPQPEKAGTDDSLKR